MADAAVQIGSGQNGNSNGNGSVQVIRDIPLVLTVRDPEVVQELARRSEGSERTEYALAALRLGVLALRQAGGMLDAQMVRSEGERLVCGVREAIQDRSYDMLNKLNDVIKGYFDPASGMLPQRLNRLVCKDGELEKLFVQHVGGDTSTIAQTLAKHIGEQSAIFRLLSPKQTDGVLAALSKTIEDALKTQQDKIVGEFSLDREDSALARLVREVTDKNGQLKDDLTGNIDKVVKEFSLDNPDGALTRLVGRVEKAQTTIADEFSMDNQDGALSRISRLLETTNKTIGTNLSLDDEQSPLSRLRRELIKVITDLTKANTDFQSDVRSTLAALNARKQESERSTRHGGEFQDAVGEFLQAETQRLNDRFDTVADTVGRKPRCKVGDHLVTLGPESAAPDEHIVCEAKEQQGYTFKAAQAEIEEARENRGAQVGIFVFSKKTAPTGIEPIQRYGNDVFVIWDRDDVQSDVYLKAAMSIARAFVVRQHMADRNTQAELLQLEQAAIKIAKDAERVQQISTWAQTAKSSNQKIMDEAEKVHEDLEKQVEQLREYVAGLKQDTNGAAA